jgi:hypothetical protein
VPRIRQCATSVTVEKHRLIESAPCIFCSNLHYLRWWKRQHSQEDAPMSESIWEH